MKIKILAGESLGTRSMATYIECSRTSVFIDPGVALAPRRYGYPPHDIELETKERAWRDIVRYASKSDVVVVTHYHYDHHNPWDNLREIYYDKEIILKDFNNNINPSQIRRSRFFLHRLREAGVDTEKIRIADSSHYEFENVKLFFSPPFYHGDSPKLGYVVMVYVLCKGDSFLYTSDVEGIMYEEPLKYILSVNPRIILMDGPPTYLKRYDENILQYCFESIKKVLSLQTLEKVILDHHFMRDRDYKIWMDKNLSSTYGNVAIETIAQFMGRKPLFLEAYRDVLYEGGGINY